MDRYLQSGELGDPGHDLVVRVNDLRPYPERNAHDDCQQDRQFLQMTEF